MTKDSKIAQLQAQVEASSAEKDALSAKYEAIVKKNEGEIFVWYVIQYVSKQSLKSVCMYVYMYVTHYVSKQSLRSFLKYYTQEVFKCIKLKWDGSKGNIFVYN